MALYSGQERCTDFGGAATTKEPVRPDAGLIGLVRHFSFKCLKTRYGRLGQTGFAEKPWIRMFSYMDSEFVGTCWFKILLPTNMPTSYCHLLSFLLWNGLTARCRSGAMWMCLNSRKLAKKRDRIIYCSSSHASAGSCLQNHLPRPTK